MHRSNVHSVPLAALSCQVSSRAIGRLNTYCAQVRRSMAVTSATKYRDTDHDDFHQSPASHSEHQNRPTGRRVHSREMRREPKGRARAETQDNWEAQFCPWGFLSGTRVICDLQHDDWQSGRKLTTQYSSELSNIVRFLHVI